MVLAKNKFLLFILISIFITPVLYTYILLPEINAQKEDDNPKIGLAQEGNENITIDANIPKLIWIEAQLTLTVETLANVSGELKILFAEIAINKYFSFISQKEDIDEDFKHIFDFRLTPHLTTLPGEYQFRVIIKYYEEGSNDGVEIYDESFKAILGMGYLILIFLSIIFCTAIIVVITLKSEEIEKKPSGGGEGGIPDGKIRCPVCKKLIEEGLSFCPECGDRIPDFLKFSSNP